jgi:hypothetical protein
MIMRIFFASERVGDPLLFCVDLNGVYVYADGDLKDVFSSGFPM